MDILRPDIRMVEQTYDLKFDDPHQVNEYFEKLIAEYFGAPYAVSVDSDTHAIELCLRLFDQPEPIKIPKHTYVSVAMTLDKLDYKYEFTDQPWEDRYSLDPLPIVDGAVSWLKDSYQSGTYHTVSFQFQKHIPIGRGGMILLDNPEHHEKLIKMSHSGRTRGIPWSECDITDLGYHYYMTPEDAARGIDLFYKLANKPAKAWSYLDYPDLTTFDYFKNRRYNT